MSSVKPSHKKLYLAAMARAGAERLQKLVPKLEQVETAVTQATINGLKDIGVGVGRAGVHVNALFDKAIRESRRFQDEVEGWKRAIMKHAPKSVVRQEAQLVGGSLIQHLRPTRKKAATAAKAVLGAAALLALGSQPGVREMMVKLLKAGERAIPVALERYRAWSKSSRPLGVYMQERNTPEGFVEIRDLEKIDPASFTDGGYTALGGSGLKKPTSAAVKRFLAATAAVGGVAGALSLLQGPAMNRFNAWQNADEFGDAIAGLDFAGSGLKKPSAQALKRFAAAVAALGIPLMAALAHAQSQGRSNPIADDWVMVEELSGSGFKRPTMAQIKKGLLAVGAVGVPVAMAILKSYLDARRGSIGGPDYSISRTNGDQIMTDGFVYLPDNPDISGNGGAKTKKKSSAWKRLLSIVTGLGGPLVAVHLLNKYAGAGSAASGDVEMTPLDGTGDGKRKARPWKRAKIDV